MTSISPILQNKINAIKNGNNAPQQDDKIYNDLTRRANSVKPNEAKAKIVKENMLQSAVSAVKDTGKDCVNFVNIMKTGKTSDHNLGRLNDVGLKLGAVLIASFLTTQARTKKQAAMNFIGGAGFIASMSLWPKIFINLPARIVHGFNIDKKYISAQGDKKDFGLDNQYYVWDAVPEEDLRKAAKRTGIDYDSKNGKEKIQRKIQKTILQNRTLNMATVGFATPLMTALACDKIEPKVKDALIKHEYKKVEKKVTSSEELIKYLSGLKRQESDVRNVKEIEALFSRYMAENKEFDSDFFKELAGYLNLDITNDFKDSDTLKPIGKITYDKEGVAKVLEKIYKNGDKVNIKNIAEQLMQEEFEGAVFGKGFIEPKNKSEHYNLFKAIKKCKDKDNIKTAIEASGFDNSIKTELTNGIDNLDIKEAISQIKTKLLKDYVERVVLDPEQVKDLTARQIKDLLAKKGYTDNILDNITISILPKGKDEFKKTILNYNENMLSATRTRLKEYLKLLTPVVGECEESIYTQSISQTTQKLLKSFDLPMGKRQNPRLAKIAAILHIPQKSVEKNSQEITLSKLKESRHVNVANMLHDLFAAKVANIEYGSEEYKEFISQLYSDRIGENIEKVIKNLEDERMLDTICQNSSDDKLLKELDSAIAGGKNANGIKSHLQKFIKEAQVNIEAIKTRAIICANFEQRLKDGSLKDEIRYMDFSGDKIKSLIEKIEGLRLSEDKVNPLIEEINALETSSKDKVSSVIKQIKNLGLSEDEVNPLIKIIDESKMLDDKVEDIINQLKLLVYDDGTARRNNNLYLEDVKRAPDLIKMIFNKEKFKAELEAFPELKDVIDNLSSSQINSFKDSKKLLSLSHILKVRATEIFNNKAWKKTFVPMFAALVGITLAVQPLFGNIKNEFEDEAGKGGIK